MLVLTLALGCRSGTTPTGTTPTTTTSSPTDTETTTSPTPTVATGTPTGTTGATGDTSGTTTGFTLPSGIHGEAPAVNLLVPEFSAVLNDDGTARSSADLVGRPTVMWFYPAATTSG